MEYVSNLFFSKSKSPYGWVNLSNIYNLLFDLIDEQTNEEAKERIKSSIRKNIGLEFFNNFQAYCIRKSLNINI